MNRKFQLFIPVMLSLLVAFMVQDRATALFGALACATAGLAAGCMYFGGLAAIARKPFHMLFNTLLLYVVAVAIGMLLPSSLLAMLAFPLLGLFGVFQFGLLGKKFAVLVIDGPAAQPGYEPLIESAKANGIPVVHAVNKFRSFPVTVDDGAHVLVTGAATPHRLKLVCAQLRAKGYSPIIVVDAVNMTPAMHSKLLELNEEHYQMTVSGAVPSLLTVIQLKVYAYPKADCTTTTAVVLPRSRKVLVIKRGGFPYKDMDSLPGGFLNVHLENLPKGAAREVTEECFVRRDLTPGLSKFTYEVSENDVFLVDVRSEPTRDARGHVVDHGYVYIVPPEREAEVLANVSAGDDAKPGSARFEDLDEVLANPLAFDHGQLLTKVKQALEDGAA